MDYVRVAVVLTSGCVTVAQGATLTVDDDLVDFPSAEYTVIQDAIDASSDGDEILVYPGTYVGTGQWVCSTSGKAIAVRAAGPQEDTIIDGEDHRRCVEVSGSETEATVFEGLTLARGGVVCVGTSPTIRNCRIVDGYAAAGGGIACYAASPILEACEISENGSGTGGGMYLATMSSPVAIGCTIANNYAGIGGGIFCSDQCSISLDACELLENEAGDDGGGIYCLEGDVSLASTTICANEPSQIYGH